LGALAIVVVAACEPAHGEDRKPVPIPPAPTLAPVDQRVACRVDGDCEIHASCCAHCSSNGIVVSVNKRHAHIGSAVTSSWYCPMCVELGACHGIVAPRLEPICKRGTCAHRKTTYTDPDRTKIAKVVELDNAPGLLDRGEERIRAFQGWMTVMFHLCARLEACGVKERGCGGMAQPGPDTNTSEVQACRKEIDAMPCANLGEVFTTKPPPACAKLRDKGR
jgi:hypothetical protein